MVELLTTLQKQIPWIIKKIKNQELENRYFPSGIPWTINGKIFSLKKQNENSINQ